MNAENEEKATHTIIQDVSDVHEAGRAATQNTHVSLRSPHDLPDQRVRQDEIENRAIHIQGVAQNGYFFHWCVATKVPIATDSSTFFRESLVRNLYEFKMMILLTCNPKCVPLVIITLVTKSLFLQHPVRSVAKQAMKAFQSATASPRRKIQDLIKIVLTRWTHFTHSRASFHGRDQADAQ